MLEECFEGASYDNTMVMGIPMTAGGHGERIDCSKCNIVDGVQGVAIFLNGCLHP